MFEYKLFSSVAMSAKHVYGALMSSNIVYSGYRYIASKVNNRDELAILLTPTKESVDIMFYNSFIPELCIFVTDKWGCSELKAVFRLSKTVKFTQLIFTVLCLALQIIILFTTDLTVFEDVSSFPQLIPCMLILLSYSFYRIGLMISSKIVFNRLNKEVMDYMNENSLSDTE